MTNMPPDGKGSFLTIRDLAERWKTSPRNIHRIIERGKLPIHKIGRLVRIAFRDIVFFETESRV